jgi:hypothetical protein
MRPPPNALVEPYRLRTGPYASTPDYGNCGAFRVPCQGFFLNVLASDELGWDHVSVSLPDRCPTHEEMEQVRSLFFKDDECVLQYSVPRTEHINQHPFCLHMFRPQAVDVVIPRPPSWMVGLVQSATRRRR